MSTSHAEPDRRADRTRGATSEGDQTIASYFAAFAPAPAPAWDELVAWPPDVFALANLVLDHTEGYRFVVAPPPGRRWPPLPSWADEVRLAARAWRDASCEPACEPPELVRRCWDFVTRHRDLPLEDVRRGDPWDVCTALLTLHALADEACAGVIAGGRVDGAFETRAWRRLEESGSLSRLSPTRVRIVPKAHFSRRGITIRSLSRYLALGYESVDVRWRTTGRGPPAERVYEILLVPWPLIVRSSDFRPAAPAALENMDTGTFGFFEFSPESPLDPTPLDALLAAAVAERGAVDAVILPEAAVVPDALPGIEETLARHGASFLVAGVREPPGESSFGRNYLHFALHAERGWQRDEQDKHHRWCLDEAQLRQYHLTRSLDPKKLWWEAIDIRERALHVIELGGGMTVAPLVCEDLARLDEVADLIRRIGPSLVVALLLDGPQLASRWPSRYASVIADDPGSAVLTLTASGMASRSRPPGKPRSRVVAHWNSPVDGVRELELAPGAGAILLTTAVEQSTLWTADGRSHDDVPQVTLTGVRQLRPAHPRPAALGAEELEHL